MSKLHFVALYDFVDLMDGRYQGRTPQEAANHCWNHEVENAGDDLAAQMTDMLAWLDARGVTGSDYETWVEITSTKASVNGGTFLNGRSGFRFTDSATALLFKLTFAGVA